MQEAQRVGVEKVRPLFVAVDGGIAALTPLQIDEAHSAFEEAAARYALIQIVAVALIVDEILSALIGHKLT